MLPPGPDPAAASGLKSAAAAVTGRPSAGKSTLVNRLCGWKVSIVSPVPQTTRNRVRGILTADRGQILFLDTPGYHLSRKKLNTYMTELVARTIDDADIVLYVMDGTREFGPEEKALLQVVRQAAKPTVVCLNKLDQAGPHWADARRNAVEGLPGAAVVEASALTGAGIEELAGRLFDAAPVGELMYPPEYVTDQPPDFRIAEIVREKAIAHTRQEVPHALYVRIEEMEMHDEGATLWAQGFIFVERESQTGILVGKAGAMIRTIVQESEAELREIFPWNVKLDIRVKVDRDWRKRDPLLRKLIC
jgi:GTP-binding protein Era